jgi:hypothetical protein
MPSPLTIGIFQKCPSTLPYLKVDYKIYIYIITFSQLKVGHMPKVHYMCQSSIIWKHLILGHHLICILYLCFFKIHVSSYFIHTCLPPSLFEDGLANPFLFKKSKPIVKGPNLRITKKLLPLVMILVTILP